jgi:hypothetical protein
MIMMNGGAKHDDGGPGGASLSDELLREHGEPDESANLTQYGIATSQ